MRHVFVFIIGLLLAVSLKAQKQIRKGLAAEGKRKYDLAIRHFTKSNQEGFRRWPGIFPSRKNETLDRKPAGSRNNPNAFLNRGIALTLLKKYKNGIKDFTRAADLDPGNARIYDSRAMALSAIAYTLI